MSGIATVSGKSDSKAVLNMLAKLRHRGPDDLEQYEDDSVSLGCVQSANGGDRHAQFWSDRDGAVAIDGYVFRRLGQDEPHSGLESSISSGNASISPREIFQMYAQMGPDFLRELKGNFVIVISAGSELFVARGPYGIKPLYYTETGGAIYFASEIKALIDINRDIRTFPPGSFFTPSTGFRMYFEGLPEQVSDVDLETAITTVNDLLAKAIEMRTEYLDEDNVGVFLSGGIDSSVVAAAAAKLHPGLKTFSVGSETSEDLPNARKVAKYLGTDHHELIYSASEIDAILDEVIYHLESFDQYLVRSSVANYILSDLARKHGVTTILCGEGGDELFGGYHYLKDFDSESEVREQLETLTLSGHANGFQRVDRMTSAHSLNGEVPFMDQDFLEYAFCLPLAWKIHGEDKTEKWILRKAFENDLPESIVWRKKAKFYKGSGSGDLMARIAAQRISDREFEANAEPVPGFRLRSKEELHYYRIFRKFYPHKSILETIGRTQTIS